MSYRASWTVFHVIYQRVQPGNDRFLNLISCNTKTTCDLFSIVSRDFYYTKPIRGPYSFRQPTFQPKKRLLSSNKGKSSRGWISDEVRVLTAPIIETPESDLNPADWFRSPHRIWQRSNDQGKPCSCAYHHQIPSWPSFIRTHRRYRNGPVASPSKWSLELVWEARVSKC